MRRALFWAGVALTIALVAFGIWYYVRDDYPFQLSPDQIAGLSYHSVAAPGSGAASVSGYISEPPRTSPTGSAAWRRTRATRR